MKKLKKFLVLGLVGMMVFSFAACNSSDKDKDKDDAVSAEELLENIPIDDIESLSVYFEIAADLGLDMKKIMLDQGMTEDDIQAAIDEGEVTEDDLNSSITLDMELTLDMGGDYSHLSGSMDMNAMGMEENMTMESYIDSSADDEKITYTYDEDLENWYYEVEDKDDSESDDEIVDFISKIKDYVNSAEITDEDDDKYTLDVVLDVAKMYEDESEMVDDLVGSATDSFVDTKEVLGSFNELNVTVEIDKENGYLLAVRIDLVDAVGDLLDSLAETDEETAAYSDYITANELSIDVELSDYNNVEVVIPEDVIDEATENSDGDIDIDFDDEDEDVDADVDEDEDTEVVYGGTYDIYDSDDELVSTITIPDELYVDTEYSDENCLYLENDDWDTVDISCYLAYWVEDLMEGKEYEPDLDFYTRDEAAEWDSVETNQGTVRVFVNTWSMDENFEENYHESIVYVLEKDEDSVLNVEAYIDEIENLGYTTETFIQTILQ